MAAAKTAKAKTSKRSSGNATAAHVKALHLHAAALMAHSASMDKLAAAVQPQQFPCGLVKDGVQPLPPDRIKRYVTQVAGPDFGPDTPDQTKIVPEIRPAGDAWTFAQECTQHPNFKADGLVMGRLYVLGTCKTLGDMVKAIRCCYQHHGSQQ